MPKRKQQAPARELHELAELELDSANPNRGTVRGRKAVEQSLRRLGAGRSVVVDRAGKVIAGNKTVEKARELGLGMKVVQTEGHELVVVQRLDLELEDARGRELAVADNRAGELGLSWDAEVLAALEAREEVVLAEYFTDAELRALMARRESVTGASGQSVDVASCPFCAGEGSRWQERVAVKRSPDGWGMASATGCQECGIYFVSRRPGVSTRKWNRRDGE